jgi:hypothetical protein
LSLYCLPYWSKEVIVSVRDDHDMRMHLRAVSEALEYFSFSGLEDEVAVGAGAAVGKR